MTDTTHMGEELFFRLAVNRGPALLFSLLNLGVRTEGNLPSFGREWTCRGRQRDYCWRRGSLFWAAVVR